MARYYQTVVATPILFVLLYYGVAWTLLGCLHSDAHVDQTSAIKLTAVQVFHADHPTGRHAAASVDCLDLDFHTESLGGSTGVSHHLQRLLSGVFPVRDAAVLNMLAMENAARQPWLGAVFDRFAASSQTDHTPRYVSLSVLRF